MITIDAVRCPMCNVDGEISKTEYEPHSDCDGWMLALFDCPNCGHSWQVEVEIDLSEYVLFNNLSQGKSEMF